MQEQFNQKWNEFYQCMAKPLAEITQLNIKTLNNLAKNSDLFEELSKAKKIDDILLANMKLANISQMESLTYAKKLGEIWTEAFNEFNSKSSKVMNEVAAKASGKKNEDR